jgi:hypothetical protein
MNMNCLGYLAEEKYSDPECTNVNDEHFEKISDFLNVIQDNELNTLDYELIGSVNGEAEDWWPINHLTNQMNDNTNPVKWIDETPENIKDEFDKNFKENDYRDVIYDGTENYNGTSGVFFDELNNITSIYFNINSKGTNYDIRWINKKI